MSSIAQGASINVIFRVVGLVLSMLLVVVTARIGEEERGVFSLFTLSVSLYVILFSGFGTALSHRISRYSENPSHLLYTLITVGFFLGCMASAVFYFVSYMFDGALLGRLWLLVVCAPFLLCIPFINGIFLAQGNMLMLNINAILPPMLVLLFILTCWIFTENISLDLILWSWVVSSFISAWIAMYLAREWLFFLADYHLKLKVFMRDARFSFHIGLTNLIGLLNYKIDLLLVQFFLGLSATGVYSIVIVMAELLWFLSSAVIDAAYGRIGSMDKKEASALVVRIVHINIIVLAVAAPVLYCVAWLLVPIVFGHNYGQAILPLMVLLPGIVFYGAAACLSAFFTNNLGRPEIPAMLASLSVIVNISISIILIPKYGMMGAAVATSISYFILSMASFFLFVKYSSSQMLDIVNVDIKELKKDFARLVSVLRFSKV